VVGRGSGFGARGWKDLAPGRHQLLGIEAVMDSKVEVEIEGVASAQLIRPDVAETKWLAFPLAAFAWG